MALCTRLPVLFAAALLAATSGCEQDSRPETSRDFPQADRPVSPPQTSKVTTEVQRDLVREAQAVMGLAGVSPGMSVADIGAGEGYYTIRLAQRVGGSGRVLAEDIDAGVTERLGQRVLREELDNVSIRLGTADDPQLPENSFDRVFLIRMYHEVSEPYAFLWRMRPSLRAGGQVIVVDGDRPTNDHGTPPALLFCEMQAVGFRLTEFVRKPEFKGYYAQFEAVGERPAPADISPCRLTGDTAVSKN